MCDTKRLSLVILYGLIFSYSVIDCKKTRKTKRQKDEQDATTPQPDVVTYSSFGYNEIGGPSYDGFVPSSPDYASFLNTYNQETTTRLYAPAFPTAMDNIGPEGYNNYDPQTQEGQNFGAIDAQSAPGNVQYQDNTFNIVNGPSFPATNNLQYSHDDDDESMPVYGTKLGSKNKHSFVNQYNSTNSIYDSAPPSSYADNGAPYQTSQNVQPNEPSGMASESDDKKYNIYNYAPTYPPTSYNSDFEHKPNSNSINFQKVIDFTKYKMPYPTELDHKYSPETTKMTQAYSSKDPSNDESYQSSFKYQNNNNVDNIKPKYKDTTNFNTKKPNNAYQEQVYNQLDFSNTKYGESMNDYREEIKKKPTHSNNNHISYPTWKYAFKDDNTHYNFNHTNYQQSNRNKPNPTNDFDIINSASSNVIDLTNYRFPKGSYSYFKDNNFQQDYMNEWKNTEANKNNYQEKFQTKNVNNIKGPVPAVSSYWGNSYKSYSTPSTFQTNYKKPQTFDEESEDVVHIPKKIQSHKYSKYHESKPYNTVKSKPNTFTYGMGKPIDEWNKEVATRFKSEEDLLGLRNQDTSHPSYLPTFKFNNDIEEFPKYASNFDYKATIEKWRQSYLKSKNKYKNWKNYDSDGLGSDVQPIHVPIMKPYPVEVPHPVIVPVPQPYPVRVPVPKPVAVPVVRELRVPIEKPVPYPVYKKVPYPVEKLIPVPVEKPVHVPVEKPYAVPIPHVRPVFHHSRPTRDEADMLGDFEDHDMEEEYYPTRHRQPERGTKKIIIRAKKPKSSRSSRRPTPSYPERSRRRWPSRRPTPSRTSAQRFRPPPRQYYPGRHRDFDPENLDHDENEYYNDYCRRNGSC